MNGLRKSDYLRLKWPILALVASIVIGLGLYATLSAADASATRALNLARAELDFAQSRVDRIEEEESTIREYIGHYQEISRLGVLGGEDRLQLLERFAALRETHGLFPIDIEIAGQKKLPLQYGELSGKPVGEPGRPVAVQVSAVNFTLPLLHENDLSNLLAGLLEGSELIQAQTCTISASSVDSVDYLRLGQHFNAGCSLAWYTLSIEGPAQ